MNVVDTGHKYPLSYIENEIRYYVSAFLAVQNILQISFALSKKPPSERFKINNNFYLLLTQRKYIHRDSNEIYMYLYHLYRNIYFGNSLAQGRISNGVKKLIKPGILCTKPLSLGKYI